MNETGVTIQEFLAIYQAANGQFDTLMMFIAAFATLFGIIVAVVVAFFAIRQINVDREIRKYRDEIRGHKEAASETETAIKNHLSSALGLLSEAKDTKKKYEEELKKPPSTETLKEIKKLQEKIEILGEDIAYRRGMLSIRPSSPWRNFDGLSSDSLLSVGLTPPRTMGRNTEAVVCDKCGTVYVPKDILSMSFATGIGSNKCPRCNQDNL